MRQTGLHGDRPDGKRIERRQLASNIVQPHSFTLCCQHVVEVFHYCSIINYNDDPTVIFCHAQMNMMMFDMHPDTAKHFYKEACPTGREMTKKTGIAELVPGAVVDDIAFDPCG